jgi:hypothetical protein
MPTAERETVVKLSDTQVSVRFPDNVLITVTEKGEVSIKKGSDTFGYSPSRLRKNTMTVFQTNETTEALHRFAVNDGVILTIKTERSEQNERLSVEVFFQEATEEGTQISGCFITKQAASSDDWAVSFLNTDRFLLNLTEMFGRE